MTTDEEHTMIILRILKIFKFPKKCGTLELEVSYENNKIYEEEF